jgi:quercetin dioxygenase-like cupin family protein
LHHIGRYDETALATPSLYAAHSQGFRRVALVDHTTGSVHQGLYYTQLDPGGTIDPHVCAYERGVYILEGQAILARDDRAFWLKHGDFAVIPVGATSGWRNAGSEPLRWLEVAAPQPKPSGRQRDTFFLKNGTPPDDGVAPDFDDPNTQLLGHFDASQVPPAEQRRQEGNISGVYLNIFIKREFGAQHHNYLFIQYPPGAHIKPHDHTFEETYFIMDGQVEVELEGVRTTLHAGDVVWTSVGCAHAFYNTSDAPVSWLETFAPQPPAQNVFRFFGEWEEKARAIEG